MKAPGARKPSKARRSLTHAGEMGSLFDQQSPRIVDAVHVEPAVQAIQIIVDGFPRAFPVPIVINHQYPTFAKERE